MADAQDQCLIARFVAHPRNEPLFLTTAPSDPRYPAARPFAGVSSLESSSSRAGRLLVGLRGLYAVRLRLLIVKRRLPNPARACDMGHLRSCRRFLQYIDNPIYRNLCALYRTVFPWVWLGSLVKENQGCHVTAVKKAPGDRALKKRSISDS